MPPDRGTTDVLRTERLALEPWSQDAADLLATLARTPAVVRYIGDGTTWSDARIVATAAAKAVQWDDHGFGWRLARLDGAPIGFIALELAGEGAGIPADDHEIGWWLDPAAWGRGLASEAAAAVRDEAFQRVGAPHITARIQPTNAASHGVARGIGLRIAGQIRGRFGEPADVLRLSAAEWAQRR